MPEFQMCTDFVIPKIVMSQAHDDEPCKCNMSPGPEITCSPSPCVYDDTSAPPQRRRKSSCCGLFPSRSPSPSLIGRPSRKRSASPRMRIRSTSETAYGYEQYSKSLLEVPSLYDYGDASSDDLSSEWDSDVSEIAVTNESKVRILNILVFR